MDKRALGATGIEVSEIGFGTWSIGGDANGTMGYGPADDQESLRALAEARALGCTFFDTSSLYGWGHSEELLGRAFSTRRHDVVIATKCGYVTPEGQQDFSATALRQSLEGSLRRLGSDYVDLLQLHSPPPDLVDEQQAGLFSTLESFRTEGLIRAYGISARSPEDARLFATRYQPAVLQVNFNLGDLRALRSGLFDLCVKNSIGVIVRTPLAAGFLTGQLGVSAVFAASDHRRRYAPEMRARWAEAVRLLRPVFDDAPGATPAQNAIRFCLSFDAVSAVIPGMTSTSDVTEDIGAVRFPRLDQTQLQTIAAVYDRVFGGVTA